MTMILYSKIITFVGIYKYFFPVFYLNDHLILVCVNSKMEDSMTSCLTTTTTTTVLLPGIKSLLPL